MFGLLILLLARVQGFLMRTMPTNFGILAIMSPRGLKWGVPAMLIAVPYTLAAAVCFDLVENGWAEWLNLVGVLFIWNAFKFVAVGPASVIRLVRVRVEERRVRTHLDRR